MRKIVKPTLALFFAEAAQNAFKSPQVLPLHENRFCKGCGFNPPSEILNLCDSEPAFAAEESASAVFQLPV